MDGNVTGSDYNASSIPPILTVPPGMTEQCFNMQLVDDNVSEPNETVFIGMWFSSGTVSNSPAQVTIEDDDG